MGPQRLFYRRHLPHYQPLDAAYHVVFRLAGSMPAHIIAELKQERERMEERLRGIENDQERRALYLACQHAYLERFDEELGTIVSGPFWLREDSVAAIVAAAIAQRDSVDYDLYAPSIMPNHVHMVFNLEALGVADGSPREQEVKRFSAPVTHIIGALKGSTARQCNLSLQRTGSFWQDESYDHVIRTPDELERTIWYVLENPVKAGFVRSWEDWKWTYVKPDLIPRF